MFMGRLIQLQDCISTELQERGSSEDLFRALESTMAVSAIASVSHALHSHGSS